MDTSGLASNQFFTGGIVLMVLGQFMNIIQSVLGFVGDMILRQFYVSVEINSSEDAFDWLLQWITANPKMMITTQSMSLQVQQKLPTSAQWRGVGVEKDISNLREPPSLKYLLGQGTHFLVHNGKLFCIKRIQSQAAGEQANGLLTSAKETLCVSTFGRSVAVINDMVNIAMQTSLEKDKGKMIVYTIETMYTTGWTRALARKRRPLESVILDSNVATELVEDAKKFFSHQQWYSDLGVPYRRSYLLHGRPGCGKTSFVAALAGDLNMNICMLTLSNQNLNDTSLGWYLREAPHNSIILLEDIDAAFPSRKKSKDDEEQQYSYRVTFSGLLNALDGITSQEGRLFVMTTNHPERLDAAIMRPGRVDVQVEFNLTTKNQAERMFIRFFPEEKDLARKFAENWEEDLVSMAALQRHLMIHRGEPLTAFNSIDKLKVEGAAIKLKELKEREERDRKKREEEEDEEEEEEKKRQDRIKKRKDRAKKKELAEKRKAEGKEEDDENEEDDEKEKEGEKSEKEEKKEGKEKAGEKEKGGKEKEEKKEETEKIVQS